MIRILSSWNVCYQLNGLIKVCVWAQMETSETWPCKLFFQQNTKKKNTHTAKKDIASRKCLCTITYVHLMNDVVTQSDSNCYYFWTAYSTIVDIFFISHFFLQSPSSWSAVQKRGGGLDEKKNSDEKLNWFKQNIEYQFVFNVMLSKLVSVEDNWLKPTGYTSVTTNYSL